MWSRADERPARRSSGGAAGVEPWLGRSFPDPADFDVVVPSPGVPPERYRSRAARVWGDIELAGAALSVPIVAVTGTNGKSTTTALVVDLLRAAGLRAAMAGNVGTPALSLVGMPLDAAVLEVSSFQLETTERFRPAVAVVLNLTPDHLDRHHTLEAYAARVVDPRDQRRKTGVLNAAERGRAFPRRRARARAAVPGHEWPRRVRDDAGSSSSARRRAFLAFAFAGAARRAQPREREAAAALCSARAPLERAWGGGAPFRPLPHRTEVVARRRGVTWSTTRRRPPGAALRALEGKPRPFAGRRRRAKGPSTCAAGGSRARALARGGADRDPRRRSTGAARRSPVYRSQHRGRGAPRGRVARPGTCSARPAARATTSSRISIGGRRFRYARARCRREVRADHAPATRSPSTAHLLSPAPFAGAHASLSSPRARPLRGLCAARRRRPAAWGRGRREGAPGLPRSAC